MRDLINATLETLLEFKSPEYIEISKTAHEIKDELIPGLQKIADRSDKDTSRALVQALFETGLLSTTQINFNEQVFMELTYGVKTHEAIDTFLELFNKLTEGGYTSLERSEMYNSSGDNFSAAFEYNIKPTESEIKIHNGTSEMLGKEDKGLRTDVKRKVIYLEGASPAYAIILEYCVFSNTPKELIILNMKNEYNDPNVLPELDKKEFDVKEGSEYSPYNLNKTVRIVTTLKIKDMSCVPVFQPYEINRALDDLYCSHFALLEDLENS